MLQGYARAYGLRSISFRYFNAAGAHPSAGIGERHDPETHLIPNILKSLLSDGRPLRVFGDSYYTPDGSCVRDYIHVDDICEAHLLAAKYLEKNRGSHVMNLGNGAGFSVFDVIAAARKVTGIEIAYEVASARPGDPPTLVANATKAMRELEWQTKYVRLEEIIETAWDFHRQFEANRRTGE